MGSCKRKVDLCGFPSEGHCRPLVATQRRGNPPVVRQPLAVLWLKRRNGLAADNPPQLTRSWTSPSGDVICGRCDE